MNTWGGITFVVLVFVAGLVLSVMYPPRCRFDDRSRTLEKWPTSFAPKDHYTATLSVPGSARPAIAEIDVPQGFEMEKLRDSVKFKHEKSERQAPYIELRSRVSREKGDQREVPPLQEHCDALAGGPNPERGTEAVRLRSELRRDGWVEVCRFEEHSASAERSRLVARTWTRVARVLRWRGIEFSCEVRFGEHPAVSHIQDGIDVCDTMHLQSHPARWPECPLRAFRPSKLRSGLIWTDSKNPTNPDSTLVVDITVPDGYQRLAQSRHVSSVSFYKENCPRLTVALEDPSVGLVDDFGCPNYGETPVLLRHEKRVDGWASMCQMPSTGYIRVVRRIQREKQNFYCMAEFNDWDWMPDENTATPSLDRSEDVIAVCDSVRLHEVTPREQREASESEECLMPEGLQDSKDGRWISWCSEGTR